MTGVDLRRGRWALSFADMCLLLLGFFVLIHASDRSRDALVSGVGGYFGGSPMPDRRELPARTLFVPGEALLTPAGARTLADIARRSADRGEGLEILSLGREPGGNRFDGWDLAAARLAAVARALERGGVTGDRLKIRGLDDQADAATDGGQRLILSAGRAE